ncbi:macrophage mannose receptor 1-like isoform X2 [Hydra vulgaris]|uniref:Macrophage mannose receptor 1-like isoform X2 n=1 Tax=Hydra vulgaris TaxID=6087 RepID=A0ABM4B2F9_HYDVU
MLSVLFVMQYLTFYYLFCSLNTISSPTAAQALTTKEVDGQVCPDGWVKYGLYCYLFQTGNPTQSGKSWTDSFSSCLSNGGNLLSVADQAENLFILNYLKNNSMNDMHFWIGLNTLQRSFVWSDNTTPLFFNWRQDQPDNSYGGENCVEASSYGWSDASCDNLYGFVCKIKKEAFGCLNSLFEFGSFCYLFHSGSATQNGLSWKMSLTVCQTMGGNLLSVSSQAESSFIINHLSNNSMNDLHFWIGLNNLQRTFVWSDHTALLFFGWSQDQPNNYLGVENCVSLNFNGWYDTSCDYLLGFICKLNREFNGQVCPDGWIKYGIYCYLFQNGNAALYGKNWINSLSYCLNNGGNLLSVANQTENLFILNYLKNNSMKSFFWIGLNALQRYFFWSDNTAPLFFNWRPGQPDNYFVKEHCVETNSYGWNDADCDNLYGFVCKIKKEVFGCPNSLFEYGDYCYLFYSGSATQNRLSWQMSFVVCKTWQGNLLNIADEAENSFILNHLKNISMDDLHFWIGLNNLQRTYVWSDHKTSLFYGWSKGQPNNYSNVEVCVDVTSNGWSDASCDNTYGFICKTKQDNKLSANLL